MSFIPASLIILTIASLFAVLFKRKLAETVFITMVAVIFILYCFSLLNIQGSLLYGIFFIAALAVFSIIFLVIKFFKNRELIQDAQLLRGCLIYLILLIVSLIFNYGRIFTLWDEFSHWGTIVKHFFVMDALGTVEHPNYELFCADYIPGVSLIKYFFTRFSNQFVEHNAYIALNMLYFSMVMPLVKDLLNRKKWVLQALLLMALIVLPMAASPIHFHFYRILYVDLIMGTFFGFAMLYYFMYRYEGSVYGTLMVSAAAFMVVMTKDIGLAIALGVVAIILADLVLFRRKEIKNMLSGESCNVRKIGKFALLLLPLIMVLFANYSWANLITRSGIDLSFYIPTLRDVGNVFTGDLEPHQLATRNYSIAAINNRLIINQTVSISTFTIMFLSALTALSILLRKLYGGARMLTAGIILTAGLYVYLFVIQLVMIFHFNEREGIQLASYERYVSTYTLGMLIFLVVFFVKNLELKQEFDYKSLFKFTKPEKKNSDQKIGLATCFSFLKMNIVPIIACFGILVSAYAASIFTLRVHRHQNLRFIAEVLTAHGRYDERYMTTALRKWMPYFVEEDPYLIDQGGFGFDMWMMRYELMPHARLANIRSVTEEGNQDYSLNTFYVHGELDDFTFVTTPEAWEQHVFDRGYTLVYVWRADDTLRYVFGEFFVGEVDDDMLFRVTNEDGNLVLVPLPPFPE